ncbi:MAG: DUF4442 domain-containing protein [Syntrophales bacterium]|nr:DUF4442 domain-containing protein [Syntrophales bacterium]
MTTPDQQAAFIQFLEKAIGIIAQMGLRIETYERGLVRIRLPKAPNVNHIGTVYAGSLFSLADFAGGVLFFACFDHRRFYPILREATIRFRRPATTDVTVEVSLPPERIAALSKTAEETGKADFILSMDLKDEAGHTCCEVEGSFQMRRAGP